MRKDQTTPEYRLQGSRWRLRLPRSWRSLLGWAFSTPVLQSEFSAQSVRPTTAKVQLPRVSDFEQKTDSLIERFSTSGRTLVDSVIELAYKYQVPMAIEYADRTVNLGSCTSTCRSVVSASAVPCWTHLGPYGASQDSWKPRTVIRGPLRAFSSWKTSRLFGDSSARHSGKALICE